MNSSKEPENKVRKCFCPYCEEELAISAAPYCKPCGMTLRHCIQCQRTVARDAEVCPHCGGELAEGR